MENRDTGDWISGLVLRAPDVPEDREGRPDEAGQIVLKCGWLEILTDGHEGD
jgi:hypothetical protein